MKAVNGVDDRGTTGLFHIRTGLESSAIITAMTRRASEAK